MRAETFYLFRHAVMREVAYQLHVPSTRAELHAMVLRLVEEIFSGEELELLARELADHSAAGTPADPGLAVREAHWLRVAADHATRSYQNAEAINLLERLAAHPKAHNGRRCLLEAAKLALILGRSRECERLLPGVSDDPRLEVDCMLARSEARLGVADFASARELAQAAQEVAEKAGLPDAAMTARITELAVLAREGHFGQLREKCEAILPGLTGVQLTRVQSHLGNALLHQEELEKALEIYEQCEAAYLEMGDSRAAFGMRGNIGHVLRRMRRAEEGLECYLHVDREARRTGDQRSLMVGLGNLGNAYRQLRRFDEALDTLRQAETMAREIGDAHAVSMHIGARGGVLFELNRLEEAYECFKRAVSEHRRLGSLHGLMTNIANLGTIAAGLGRYEEAVEAITEALALMDTLEMRNAMNEFSMREVMVRSLSELGRRDDALEAAREALGWLDTVDTTALMRDPEVKGWAEMIRRVAEA